MNIAYNETRGIPPTDETRGILQDVLLFFSTAVDLGCFA